MTDWKLVIHPEVLEWLHDVRKDDKETAALIGAALNHVLRGGGPSVGRPLVDRLKHTNTHNLKELRPASSGTTEVRIIFAFDPERHMVLLVGGDKSGQWTRWYKTAIPLAEARFEEHLAALDHEED